MSTLGHLQRYLQPAIRSVLTAILVITGPQVAPGQFPPAQNPANIADPLQILGRFLGEENEADRQAIAAIKISRHEENQVGNKVLKAFLNQIKQRKIPIQTDGREVAYLQSLVTQLKPLMQHSRRYRKISIYVIDTDDTDAKSFPGGSIAVARGLIDFCESEAALVGVLGHELSHIDRAHQLQMIKRWKFAQRSFQQPSLERMMSVSNLMARSFMRPFRPHEESEADADGAKWAWQLGYDPMQLAHLFKRLQQRDAGQQDLKPSFLRSHPIHADRFQAIAKLANQWKSKDRQASFYVGIENLRKRIARTKREFID